MKNRLLDDAKHLNLFLTFLRMGLLFYLFGNAIFNFLFIAVQFNVIKNRTFLDRMLTFSGVNGDLTNYIDFLYCRPEISAVLVILLAIVYTRKFMKNLGAYESSLGEGQLPQFEFDRRLSLLLFGVDIAYMIGNILSTYNAVSYTHLTLPTIYSV
eukprot:TRINITY_DN2864_c0_g1_i1.p1 TRINITY_DN2864_c0_g1~~TRINITY_DN2864_c0_g1_i1.p1  ORF type:complete len:155 (-),score=42.09 TRINITY_DN2864_c0_g1_i1:35-499(-)